MQHMAIMYYQESGFALFETTMRTADDMAEHVKHVAHHCLWGKIFTDGDGCVVAEWKAPNVIYTTSGASANQPDSATASHAKPEI